VYSYTWTFPIPLTGSKLCKKAHCPFNHHILLQGASTPKQTDKKEKAAWTKVKTQDVESRKPSRPSAKAVGDVQSMYRQCLHCGSGQCRLGEQFFHTTIYPGILVQNGEMAMKRTYEHHATAEGTFQFRVDISRLSDVMFSPPFLLQNLLPWRMMLERQSHPVYVSHSITNSYFFFKSLFMCLRFIFANRVKRTRRKREAMSFYLECNADAKTSYWSCNERANLRVLKHNGGQPVARGIGLAMNMVPCAGRVSLIMTEVCEDFVTLNFSADSLNAPQERLVLPIKWHWEESSSIHWPRQFRHEDAPPSCCFLYYIVSILDLHDSVLVHV
jgi:hypothetical protein